jgi:hypothetical protein
LKVIEILAHYEELKKIRELYEPTWEEINELFMPNRPGFYMEDPNSVTTADLYDSTGVQSAEYLAATLMNGLVNQETRWFELEPEDLRAQSIDAIRNVLDDRSRILYTQFNRPESGFYSAMSETLLDLVVYGTAALEIEYLEDTGINFRAIHLAGIYIAVDKRGVVDTVFRKFYFTARQAAQMWGIEALGPKMLVALEKEPYRKFEIIRCVKPEESYTKRTRTKKPYYSSYVCVEDKHILSEGGMSYFPYVVARWTKLTNQEYGRSPAWAILSDVNMVQGIKMSILEIMQKQADPQKLVADDGVMLPLDNEPGSEIYGGIDPITGARRVDILQHGGNPLLADKMLEDTRNSIRRAYYDTSLNSQNLPQMTAEEVITRSQESLRTIAPNANRIMMELLDPCVKIAYMLLKDNKEFAEAPEEVVALAKELGADLKVTFTGPLARTAKAYEVLTYSRWFNQIVLPTVQFDPTILDAVNLGESVRVTAAKLGVDHRMLNTREEEAAIKEQRQQQQEMQMKMQLAAQADQAETQRMAVAQNAPATMGGPADDGTI